MQDVRVGLVLDKRYRIDEWLAAGGTGVVYRGTRLGLEKGVAIKFLHQSGVDSPNRRKRFQREAEAMSRLTHPNLATVIDFGSEDGVPYLVMELYDGASLRQTLEAGPLDPVRAINITKGILAGLASAHAAGVVHRDLKPANVMLTPSLGDDHIKILDFGVAKFLATESNTEVSVTAGGPQGTPQYMSPEQARGQPIAPTTDLYAVGVMLYEMTTGERPFDGGVGFAILRQQVEDEATPPRALVADLSEELEAVILQAMAKEASDRFQTAAQMASALARVPEVAPPRRRKREGNRSGRLRVATLLIALVSSLVFAGWYAAASGWIEVPAWSPWRPSSEVATSERPPPAAPAPVDASVAAPDGPPPWQPPDSAVTLGEPPPSTPAQSTRVRGSVARERFVATFARLAATDASATLELAEAAPAGNGCRATLERVVQIAIPRSALVAGARAEGETGVVVVAPDSTGPIEARWRVRLSAIDATTGIAAGELRVRGKGVRLAGAFTATYCAASRDLVGVRPRVNGLEWDPDLAPSPDSLPDAAVAGALGTIELRPKAVKLRRGPSPGTVAVSFDGSDPASCDVNAADGASVLVTLREQTVVAGASASTALADAEAAPNHARFQYGDGTSAVATSLALRIDAIDSRGVRGRIAVVASDRRRSLLAGAFLARDCR